MQPGPKLFKQEKSQEVMSPLFRFYAQKKIGCDYRLFSTKIYWNFDWGKIEGLMALYHYKPYKTICIQL